LCGSLAYQFLTSEHRQPKHTVVDTVPAAAPAAETVSAHDSIKPSTHIRTEAPQLLQRQLERQRSGVAQVDQVKSVMENVPSVPDNAPAAITEADDIAPAAGFISPAATFKTARSAAREPSAEYAIPKSEPVQQKPQPLVVLDGKAVTAKNDNEVMKKINGELADKGQPDSIVVLPDPLYIINGVEYSEESLFGTNPTSPYAPLNRQEIESISVLQKEEAVKTYGKKGVKGVVIIATKGGKPAPKK
jgi:hypothetical protein